MRSNYREFHPFVNAIATGDIYIQVYGKNGAFSISSPYTLTATVSPFPGGCVPAQCNFIVGDCGTMPDDCGGQLLCGSGCVYLSTCGGGLANFCGTACTTYQSCDNQGKNCGIIPDGYSGTLDCGTCTAPETCGGGGVPNVCGSP